MKSNLESFKDGIIHLSYSRDDREKFQDWCEAVAVAMYQASYKLQVGHIDPELEEQYMKIVAKYGGDFEKFPKLIEYVVNELSVSYCDFLGQAYMELELGNFRTGQFFTPYSICKLNAEMIIGDVELNKDNSPITLCEPACGSGSMVIAAAEVLMEKGINYQEQMHVETQDISLVCFHMAYIQLNLLGISAEVCYGDTLRMETWKRWRTLMSVYNGFTVDGIEAYRKLMSLMISCTTQNNIITISKEVKQLDLSSF